MLRIQKPKTSTDPKGVVAYMLTLIHTPLLKGRYLCLACFHGFEDPFLSNREQRTKKQEAVKVYMTQNFSAYLKGLSKYRKMAFLILKYLFSVFETLKFFYHANEISDDVILL